MMPNSCGIAFVLKGLFYFTIMNLPFYKFQPDRWEFGDISVEPFDIQGLFLNICNYYWKKITDENPKRVAITTLKARYNKATDAMFDRLFEIGVIKDNDGFIVINFLDEQLAEISEQKEMLSNAGKAGANKRWSKNRVAITTSVQSQSDSNSNKDKEEDKDKIKTKNKNNTIVGLKNFKKFTKEQFAIDIKECHDRLERKLTKDRLMDFYNYWTEPNPRGVMRFQLQPTWETGRRLATWRDKQKEPFKQPEQSSARNVLN